MKTDLQSDRKFLHDLATPITVAKTMVRKVTAELGQKADEELQAQIKRLESALIALEQIEHLHADQKERLYQREEE